MSDMSLDRDMERVDPSGCDMKAYKKNPIVLWAHDHSRPAIGKCNNPKIKDNQVVGNIEFDSATNDPFAGMIAGKVKAGIINAGSIGFKPNVIEWNEDNGKDPTKLIHRKWELMEFSICNVPANANARQQAAGSLSVEETEEKAALEAKVKALEAQIEELKNGKKTWIAELLADHGKPSRDAKTENRTAQGTIEAMFPSKPSRDDTNGLEDLLGG
jgi:HK97 family phage prohead protease